MMLASLGVVLVSVITSQADLNRTGWNPNEAELTPANISRLLLLGSNPLDGAVFAQPLIVQSVNTPDGSMDLLLSCTMNNSCYAFRVNAPGTIEWHTSLPVVPITTPDLDLYAGQVGCLNTPAIDPTTNTLYVACASNVPSWVLFAIDIRTGTILRSVIVTATFNGFVFNPAQHMMRPAVTLANGNVYLFAGSYGDVAPWQGWAFAYNAQTFTQVGVFCTAPNTTGGSIWMAGGGAAVDASGNLYVVTGNGAFDGSTQFSDSLLKFSPALQLLDWFTPSNWPTINSTDEDLATDRTILIPGTNLLTMSGKDFRLFVLNGSGLGHLGATPVQLYQMPGTANFMSGAYGSAFGNGQLYIPTTTGGISRFVFNGSTFNTPANTATLPVNYPGPAALSISSNGTQDMLLWATTPANGQSADHSSAPGVLRVLDPTTLQELWNSGTTLGTLAKFAAPTVANGRVYVATFDGHIQVYGLPTPSGTGRISINSTGVSPASRR